MSDYMIQEQGSTCPRCEKMFAVDEILNDNVYWLSPCCRARMGKLKQDGKRIL